MKNRSLFLLLGLVFSLSSTASLEAAVLINRDEAGWRWRHGSNEASAPIGAWRAVGFNDSEFTTAPAPFWFGDVRPGGTQITSIQSNYLCIFLRKTFVITNTAEIGGFRLNYFVDDGFVAWINGTEVYRDNVNVVEVNPTIATLATNQQPDPAVLILSPVVPAPPGLIVGTNVLAVQVIQSSLTSSDFGFDTSLETVPAETNPPVILTVSPTAGSTVGALASITVTFNEPVTGVDAADLRINGNPATGVTPSSSSVYTFTFSQPGSGTVLITWDPSHGIVDTEPPFDAFNATGPGATWQYNLQDQTAPTVATLSPSANATVRSLTVISVVFSENVTGVDAADLLINTIPASGVSGAANAYTFTFTQPNTGMVQVAWAGGHGIVDTATVPNAFAGGTWSYTFDPNAGQRSGPTISEFMADNSVNSGFPGYYPDEDGDTPDWVEIENVGTNVVSLLDWSLTDTTNNLNKWRFPATNMAPGSFLVVFASEKDRRVPGRRLHTNFKLEAEGEYLALIRPDGSIASEFKPTFPAQVAAVSFGFGVLTTNSTLVATNAPVRVRIPASGADGTNWLYVGFDDSSWTLGTNGVGYGTTNVTAADYSAAVVPTGPILYWRFSETAGATVANLGSMGVSGNGNYINSPTLDVAGPRPPAFNGFEANNRAVQLIGTASTDYVGGPAALLSGRTLFTMAGWIRPTAAQAARTGIFGQNDSVEFGFISAGTIQVWTPSGNIAAYAYPYPDNEWHHIAVVGTNATLNLYLDGTLRATSAGAAAVAGGGFNVGGGGIFDATGNDFLGQIDEVAVWDRALSQPELLALFNAGTTPGGVPVVPYIKTDVTMTMSNVNATAFVRLPFSIDNPANIQVLALNVRYDDGFVAYLNGVEVARANAPASPAYNSAATNTHTVISTDQFLLGTTLLRAGGNVLAIQGLNITNNDEDFLIGAELTATHAAASSDVPVYMTGPTPGTANGVGVSVLGPIISEPTQMPNVPSETQDIVVTARVTPTFASLSSVVVRYKVMYGVENELTMFDDGMHGDGQPGDGVYGQTLPIAAASTNGQMIRWYFRATDGLGRVGRWPLFLSAVEEEYLGTVVDPTYVTSQLPVFHLFAAAGVLQTAPPTTQTGADGEAGGRISIFYDGEFYDNVHMELRGNTSAGQNKKSHRLEFNRNHEFRHLPGFPRVRKTSFMAEFLDPAYIRQHLSFWMLEQMGMATPFFYPVRAQLNAQFYALVFHNDVIGQEQVERMGYDPKGALYKAAGNVLLSRSSTGVFQKLEPDGPPDYTDYNQLANGIVETATLANRRIAAFDMLDIPEVINYLAGARWCAENDDVWANMSIYRDTFGDQLWRIIPFDMNASWGQRYGGITPLDAIADNCKSHPLYGGSTIIACDGGTYNRIYDVVIAVPELRQMLLRRQRTALDRWILEPGVAPESRLLETHIRYMTNQIWNEAFLDRAKWGYSTWTASNKPLTNGVNELFNEFINLRRIHFSATHNVTNVAKPIGITPTSNAGIPLSQPLLSLVTISNVEFNPSSGNQNHEYIQVVNANNYALDITGWKLDGAVSFKFKPGTIIPSNSVIYVSPNVLAFKQRSVSPKGGEGNFVVGPYEGQLNARGESLVIHDNLSRLVTSNAFVGAPSLAQQHLRITEIMYNPAPLAGNTNDAQQFEYLELKNISGSVMLNLTGVRLTNGVEFNFTGSTVTSLLPGARVLVVRNLAAFTARYGVLPNVAGQFAGALDSNGETVRLDDASGEKVLEFSYNNSWYPITDGHGFSLVIVDENAAWDTWGMKSSWRPSGALNGSPGVVDPAPSPIAGVLITEVLSHTDLPLVDSVELWNPTGAQVNIGGWFLSDDFTNAMKYRFPDPTLISAGSFITVDEGQFNPNPGVPPSFALSSLGDEIYLFSGDANTNLTGYVQGYNFGAAETGVAFGRYVNSQTNTHFVAQKSRSPMGANLGPRVGPIVFSEIMYHPRDNADGSDNSVDEFVELRSITNAPTPLFDDTNAWWLRGGIDYDFPPGTTLTANTTVVIAAFDPTNTTQLASFRSRFGIPAGVPVYGPFSGKLDNSSDTIRLLKPDAPDTNGFVPHILVEEIEYEHNAPWPVGADGTGASLQRRVTGDYGNDATNWVAATVSGGGLWAGGTPPSINVQPSSISVGLGLTAMLNVGANGSGLRYQWRYGGGPISGATNAILVLPNVQIAQSGNYEVVVYNDAGSVLSSTAYLNVFIPAQVFQQPQSVALRGSTNAANYGSTTNLSATFSVGAAGTGTLLYQWRFNGVPIAGATNASHTVTNVTLAEDGVYDVTLNDAIGSIASDPARLTVLLTPTFIVVPAAQTVPAGGLVSASVVFNGNPPPFGVHWRTNNQAASPFIFVTNERTNYFTFNSHTNVGAVPWRLVITNAAFITPGSFYNFTITTIADTDHDGIPDNVETGLGLNTNSAADASGDLDGDTMSNLAEYLAGTNPTNALSYLRIDFTNGLPPAAVVFAAVSNRTYTVQYTDALSNPTVWSKLADVPARATNRTEMFVDPGWTTNRFYRVALPQQP